MRHLLPLLPLLAALLFPGAAQAQRIAFVNTKYILEKLDDYDEAQKELDRLSRQWQNEIDDRHQLIKRLRDAYNAEAILLTEEMKRNRLDDIERQEREARDLQKRRFGPNGDLFKKRQELIQPIQDRVYNAIKEVAGTSYLAIFDLGSTNTNLLFASEKYDKSDAVLRKLGVRPGRDGGGRERERDDGFGDPMDEPGQQRDGGSSPPPDRGRDGGGGTEMKPR